MSHWDHPAWLLRRAGYPSSSLIRTVEPAILPITLAELRAHARIDSEDEDALLMGYARAAIEWVEKETDRALITQTWQLTLDTGFPEPPNEIRLRKSPVQSISSIQYVDENGATQTLATSVYQTDLNSEPARIRLGYNQTWPTVRLDTLANVTVTYVAGYGDNWNDVPQSIRDAVAVRVLAQFDGRTGEELVRALKAADRLIEFYRMSVAV